MFLAEFLKVGLDKTFRSDLKTTFLHSTMNGGFIIKCRDIPAVNTSLELKHDFTDHIAFYTMVNQPFCHRQYPNSTTLFCHVTLKHSIDSFQIGPEGSVTHITSRVGHQVYLLTWKKGQYSLSDLHKPPLNGSQTKAEALRPFWLPLVQWCMHYALRISSADLCHHRFIPPLLPYIALTLSHSISQEVHTFLWQMMRQSVGGIYSLSSTHILLRMLNKLYL